MYLTLKVEVCESQPYPRSVKVRSKFTKAGAEKLYELARIAEKATVLDDPGLYEGRWLN